MARTKSPSGPVSSLYGNAFYHRPLLALLFFLAAGLVLGRAFFNSSLWYGFAAIVAGCAAARILYLLVHHRSARFSPLLLFCALGAVSLAPWQAPFFPPEGAADHINNGYVRIQGTVSAPPRIEAHCTRCILDHLFIRAQHGHTRAIGGRIRASFYGDCPPLSPGDRLSIHGKLRSFKNFNNPGGFNYRRFMADKGIWASVYTRARYFEKIDLKDGRPEPFNPLRTHRSRIHDAICRSAKGDAAAVLSALIVGKRDRITPELRDAFNRAGASHLLAISGLHIGIVATCAFIFFKWVLSGSQFLLLRGWAGKCAALCTVFPVLTYAMISGMSPSTQRAVIMVLVFLAAFVREKPYDPANTLATAALCILAAYPPALFSVSFQLSFAAVTAIFFGLYLFAPFLQPPGRTRPLVLRAAGRIRAFVLISVFAIAGTLPLVLHYFNQASVMGVVSNLILVPWIGFAVVPAGLISAAVSALSGAAGVWCFSVTAQILEPALSLIHALAELEFASFYTVTPSVPEVGWIYAAAACLGLAVCRGNQINQRALAAGMCVLVAVAAADTLYWMHQRFWHSDLRVTVLDVGQGHASLVSFPGGRTMLIDGGGFSDNRVFDVGERIVAPYLWQNKIRTIDTVVLSHADADHLNGLRFVVENFRVGRVISTRRQQDKAICAEFSRIIAKRGIPRPPFATLKRRRMIGKAEVRILYPGKTPRIDCAQCPGANNCSVVVQVRYAGRRLLFAGDIEKCAESRLIANTAADPASDVLIAPHHGSASSSSQSFVAAVDPDTVIIPVRKRYENLPSPAVLKRYRSRGCRVLRTDLHGAVLIRIEPDGRMKIQPTIGG